MRLKSFSSAETRRFGERVARALVRQGKRRTARVVTLRGELGSGKTTFVQGFARGAGARGKVVSPTFIIMRRMKIAGVSRGTKKKEEEKGQKKTTILQSPIPILQFISH
jgi:tRNA A37 threonylcarbamoyladenosine biosynthesis protein TsaE